ncbi:hypothetical protein AVEN_161120-1 [Araneus ventricosus]|uniref:Uncharacterized protein n=1 Tax=Araneus ventricosus TaxID=182803 RepID=A0A4Y2S4Q9_ARAVE|nr:hypothetical protein AVEN_161120-1 [Araneus ventricosus]
MAGIFPTGLRQGSLTLIFSNKATFRGRQWNTNERHSRAGLLEGTRLLWVKETKQCLRNRGSWLLMYAETSRLSEPLFDESRRDTMDKIEQILMTNSF